jgi:FKBP-type peptidyl-prolyl cis-trans isomerase FklB
MRAEASIQLGNAGSNPLTIPSHYLRKSSPMRVVATAALLLCSSLPCFAQEVVPLNTQNAKKISDAASYGIGFGIGSDMAQQGLNAQLVTQADLIAGIMDALAGKEPSIAGAEIQAAMKVLQEKLQLEQQKMQAKALAAGKENLAKANKFLEENKKKEGVQTTASGLQYEVIKAGTGASPKADNTVTVHYEGKLVSGKVFDSSIARNEPATFGVGQVIPGWTEALQRMKVGDKWRLFIPPNLGYGERGAGGDIGPNETLIFEVELLGVK